MSEPQFRDTLFAEMARLGIIEQHETTLPPGILAGRPWFRDQLQAELKKPIVDPSYLYKGVVLPNPPKYANDREMLFALSRMSIEESIKERAWEYTVKKQKELDFTGLPMSGAHLFPTTDYRHGKHFFCGIVLKTYTDRQYRKSILFRLFHDSPIGAYVKLAIDSGDTCSLSLSSYNEMRPCADPYLASQGCQEMSDGILNEISIVRVPARTGSDIEPEPARMTPEALWQSLAVYELRCQLGLVLAY